MTRKEFDIAVTVPGLLTEHRKDYIDRNIQTVLATREELAAVEVTVAAVTRQLAAARSTEARATLLTVFPLIS